MENLWLSKTQDVFWIFLSHCSSNSMSNILVLTYIIKKTPFEENFFLGLFPGFWSVSYLTTGQKFRFGLSFCLSIVLNLAITGWVLISGMSLILMDPLLQPYLDCHKLKWSLSFHPGNVPRLPSSKQQFSSGTCSHTPDKQGKQPN